MHISSNDKDNANERKESLLSISRVPLILYKDNANERKESLLSISRAHLILYKDTNKNNYTGFNEHKFLPVCGAVTL